MNRQSLRHQQENVLREGKRLIRASCGLLLEILENENVSVIHHSFTLPCDKHRNESVVTFSVLTPFEAKKMPGYLVIATPECLPTPGDRSLLLIS